MLKSNRKMERWPGPAGKSELYHLAQGPFLSISDLRYTPLYITHYVYNNYDSLWKSNSFSFQDVSPEIIRCNVSKREEPRVIPDMCKDLWLT